MAKKTTNTEPTEKKIGLFDCIGMIEGEKLPWNDLSDDYHKAYSQFMINRFISSKEAYIPIIDEVSRLKLTDEQHYGILCSFIANNRRHYFDYKAYKKEKEETDVQLLTFAIAKEYELGYREAKMYINKLDDTVKTKLKSKWKDLYDSQK